MSDGSRREFVELSHLVQMADLGRAVWIAAEGRKLFLAALGLVLVSAGAWLLDELMWSVSGPSHAAHAWPWDRPYARSLGLPAGGTPFGSGAVLNASLCLQPAAEVTRPVQVLFSHGADWSLVVRSLLQWAWTVMVWTLLGGAIGRMAAVQFARGEQLSTWACLRFSLGNFHNYVYGPLLPLAGVLALWLLSAGIGLAGRIPGAGGIALGLCWGISLGLSFLMLLILVGVGAGWPLMFATVNSEATDGFDGLSRAFSYVYERPALCLVYAAAALALGTLGVYVAGLAVEMIIQLSGLTAFRSLPTSQSAPLLEWLAGGRQARAPLAGAGGVFLSIWTKGAALSVHAFAASFFWTGTAALYFLLRRAVDGKPLDEVYLSTEPERDRLQDIVGPLAAPSSSAGGPAPAALVQLTIPPHLRNDAAPPGENKP